jgi:hypothetical protein
MLAPGCEVFQIRVVLELGCSDANVSAVLEQGSALRALCPGKHFVFERGSVAEDGKAMALPCSAIATEDVHQTG